MLFMGDGPCFFFLQKLPFGKFGNILVFLPTVSFANDLVPWFLNMEMPGTHSDCVGRLQKVKLKSQKVSLQG